MKATTGAADFLRETLLEGQRHQRVVLRGLAERLGVSTPAVSRMAQRLVVKGLLRRDGACGLALTEAGQRIALRALRKQRVFEVYLVRELGYTWDDVFPVALSASHHLDDDLVERMWLKLGRPQRCPHGDPIPTRDGKIEPLDARPLSDAAVGASGRVGPVASHDPEMLRYLTTLGLVPGAPVSLVSRAPFGGPIRVRVGTGNGSHRFENEHVIGTELASVVHLEMDVK